MKYSRIIILVLDGFGVGLLPEVDHNVQNKSSFEDVIDSIGMPQIPTLESLGFLNMTEKYGRENGKYNACYGKMRVQSPFKDSWAGHWELAGWTMNNNMDTSYWTNGFSSTIVQQFENDTKYKIIGNKAFQRREDVLPMYIKEHMKTERSIILLTEEGVESIRTFGLYALIDKIPVEELYRICELAAEKLQSYNNIFGRIGARPLVMTKDERIDVLHDKRKDFLVFNPPENTVLEVLEKYGIGCYSVGKVSDMFRGRYITDSIQTCSNVESMDGILKYMNTISKGVIWGNLNDFDAKYGHYFNKKGWNAGLEEFDTRLKELLVKMKDDDLLVICSDGHGCDCTYTGVHTHEYSPLIVYSPLIEGGFLGHDNKLNDLAATIADNFEIPYKCVGNTLLRTD